MKNFSDKLITLIQESDSFFYEKSTMGSELPFNILLLCLSKKIFKYEDEK